MFTNIIIWFPQSRGTRLSSRVRWLVYVSGTSSGWWTHIKRNDHNKLKMLLTAIFNTMYGMAPYYIESTYKWFKMALWDAPTRVFLDVQLEQMRLERNLSEEDTDDEKQKWKNITSHLLPTSTASLSFGRLKLSVRTSSVLFGTKFCTVPNPLNPHLLLRNVQPIPGCRRLLCPENFYLY